MYKGENLYRMPIYALLNLIKQSSLIKTRRVGVELSFAIIRVVIGFLYEISKSMKNECKREISGQVLFGCFSTPTNRVFV